MKPWDDRGAGLGGTTSGVDCTLRRVGSISFLNCLDDWGVLDVMESFKMEFIIEFIGKVICFKVRLLSAV